MPNRIIRDGILESEAVLSLPVEARWLYVTILLSADDLGLFEATPFRLARRADINRDHADKYLQMVVDKDLVRLYRANKKDYGFIPRFGQKLQIKRARCPLPPDALLIDDADATAKALALKRSEESGELVGAFGQQWEQLRLDVFKRDGYKCIRCDSAESLTAHHLTPKSRGGGHTIENLATLCGTCNSWARNNEARCNEIKYLASKTVSGQHLSRSCADAVQLPEPEPEPEVEPKKKTNTRSASVARVSLQAMIAEGVDPQHGADWLAVRKAPLTRTAWEGVKREAEKAGVPVAEAVRISATKGWRGFEAGWYSKLPATTSPYDGIR